MVDVLLVAVIVGSFALLSALVRGCEAIVGSAADGAARGEAEAAATPPVEHGAAPAEALTR